MRLCIKSEQHLLDFSRLGRFFNSTTHLLFAYGTQMINHTKSGTYRSLLDKDSSSSIMSISLQPHRPSLPGSSVYGIFQAKILAWIAILPFPTPGDLPDPRMEPASLVSPALAGGFFTTALLLDNPCIKLMV